MAVKVTKKRYCLTGFSDLLIRRCVYYYYLQQLNIEMQCIELGKGKGYSFVERRYTKVGYVFCQKWQGVGAWTSGGSLDETRRVAPFLAWGDFHERSRFARSTIPEEKWGTTRSLRRSKLR